MILFYLSSLMSRLRRKRPSNVVIDSHIILNKSQTRLLRHSLMGPNPFFLDFVVDF